MQIYIRSEYTRDEKEMEQDVERFKKLFGLTKHSFGKETVYLSDWKEYRATASIDTDDFKITRIKKQ